MDGTIHSKSGPGRITRPGLAMDRRFGIVLAALGACIIGWMDISIFRQTRDLEQEFGDVRAERYYLGVHIRVSIRRLNEMLLHYHRFRDPGDLARFQSLAAEVQQWMRDKRKEPSSTEARKIFGELQGTLTNYLQSSFALAHPDEIRMENDPFETVYERLQKISMPSFELATALVSTQRRDFDRFLLQAQGTLDKLQHLFWLSSALLLGLSAAMGALVYRAMITPLRVQLHLSRDIIHRQEKLASLGVLAAGVAHEIRNPLTAIKFRLFSLKQSLPPLHAEGEDATVIASELQRLERIVKDFLQFARPSTPHLVHVPAKRLLEDVHSLLRSQLDKSAIQLKIEEPDDLWVQADSQQLKQVLINLVQNAADSIGRQGAVTLRALSGHASLRGTSREVVCLEVADTGRGIPPEVERRLFDPFFTTKEGGTGLGLPIAARIIEKHGGELHYQTQLNRGTTFRITLPRHHGYEA